MKLPLKIFLTIVLTLAVLLCLVGAFISAASFSFSIEHIIRTSSSTESLGFVEILSIISNSTGILTALGFACFFLLIAFIICIGIVAIFLSTSAKKVDTLVHVVNSAKNENDLQTSSEIKN